MARITEDSWIAARQAWETTPTMTATGLGEALGVSRQAVLKRMRKDEAAGKPWEKRVTMAEVAERAQALADKQQAAEVPEVAEVAQSSPDGSSVTPASNQKKIAREAQAAGAAQPPAATTPTFPDPVAQRAEVIAKHRREWGIPRGLVSEAVGSRNFDKAKLAKITSETLQIIQKGERTAWGLDSLDPDDKPAVVIVERSGAEVKK